MSEQHPYENEPGLSDKEVLKAKKNIAKKNLNVARRELHESRGGIHDPLTNVDNLTAIMPGLFADAAVDTSMAVKEHLNKGALQKHYQRLEGRYQVQAVQDAVAEGVQTDFGTTEIGVARLREEAIDTPIQHDRLRQVS